MVEIAKIFKSKIKLQSWKTVNDSSKYTDYGQNGETQTIIRPNIPQKKTNYWTKDDQEKMLTDALKSLEKVIRNRWRLILVRDLNCREVRCDNF